jgi:hypothetical protein
VQCSRQRGTSERNSDEVYLFVTSIAIITVRLRFLFVMAQRFTRRSTMRREVHEEKCGIQYCSRKARFGTVYRRGPAGPGRGKNPPPLFSSAFRVPLSSHIRSDPEALGQTCRHRCPMPGVPWFNYAQCLIPLIQPSYASEFGTHSIASSRLSLQLLQ